MFFEILIKDFSHYFSCQTLRYGRSARSAGKRLVGRVRFPPHCGHNCGCERPLVPSAMSGAWKRLPQLRHTNRQLFLLVITNRLYAFERGAVSAPQVQGKGYLSQTPVQVLACCGDYALLNFSFPCLQRGHFQSSGSSSNGTPSCSAGSYT